MDEDSAFASAPAAPGSVEMKPEVAVEPLAHDDPSSQTPVTKTEGTLDDDEEIPRAGLGATVEGGVRGRKPKVDLDISVEEIGGEEIQEVSADDLIHDVEKPKTEVVRPEGSDVAKVTGTASVEGNVQQRGPRVEIEIEKREVPSDEGTAPSGSETPSDGSKK